MHAFGRLREYVGKGKWGWVGQCITMHVSHDALQLSLDITTWYHHRQHSQQGKTQEPIQLLGAQLQMFALQCGAWSDGMHTAM